jgi:hypothetical protein
MLFNLSCQRHFPNKGTGKEIWGHSDYGPFFTGGDGGELGAFDEPFNGDRKCWSYPNKPGYRIPVDVASTNMLTNKKDAWFTITELEVWEVTYLE